MFFPTHLKNMNSPTGSKMKQDLFGDSYTMLHLHSHHLHVVPSQCGRHNSSKYICATSKTCCFFVRCSMVFLSSLTGFRTMGKDGKSNPPMRLNDTLSEASFEAAALIPSSAFSSACQWASQTPVIEWMITPPKFDMELQKTGLGRFYGIAV